MQPYPHSIHTDIVLVGGGHAHVAVLKAFGMKPEPGVRLTLVARDISTPYSGMIPGFIAGHYTHDECYMDLEPLCRFAGARLIHASANGIDPAARRLLFGDRPALRYDLISIDIGATTAVADIPGAVEYGLPIKPTAQSLARLAAMEPRLPIGAGIVIIGGGAGGSELALALAHRFRALCPKVTLATDTLHILPTHGKAVRERMARRLGVHGIQVLHAAPLKAVEADAAILADGRELPSDLTVLATGSAPAAWLGEAGLATDERGFLRVGQALQSTSHGGVFATGDIAAFGPRPLPKAGVHAVRQGTVLAENLRHAARGEPLKVFRPQAHFLSLLSCGEKRAIASYGPFAMEGRWVWRWKDKIDRRWMTKYHGLSDMSAGEPDAPPMRCAGCGAKVASDVLGRVLHRIDTGRTDGVILGAGDDAAVLQPPGRLLLQSADLLRAFVGDTYNFGRIATLHALSDLYAMGAVPHSALAHATLPYAEPGQMEDDLYQLLTGACAELRAAGAALIGGHSSEGPELNFGLTVNGFAERRTLWLKSGAKPGDALVLTKALGTGTLLSADMRCKARSAWMEAALAHMLTSNGAAVPVLRGYGARAVTDVTGFGLAGHLGEMLAASGVGASVKVSALPMLTGAVETLASAIESTLAPANRAQDPAMPAIAADPQTSGGLLATLPADRAEAAVRDLRAAGYANAAAIGQVVEGGGIAWA